MLKAAIFDLDGVVVDTVHLHFAAWKRMFAEYNVDFSFQMYKDKVDGIPRNSGARNILRDIAQDELVKAATRKQNYFHELIEKNGISPYVSTLELIFKMKSDGIKIAVISSSKSCRMILEHIGLISELDVVLGALDVDKGKPDPDIFLKAAQSVDAMPCQCVVFEDAVLGVEASQRAGMICVGIDRHNDPQRLSKANVVVSDLSEITLEQIKEFFKGEK